MPPTLNSVNSILQRYTPPTCTLEIATPAPPPASQRKKLPPQPDLQFNLNLHPAQEQFPEDPNQTSDDAFELPQPPIHLSGDRAQLQALHTAVITYVQQFLGQSNSLLPKRLSFDSHPPDGCDDSDSDNPHADNFAVDDLLSREVSTLITPAPAIDLARQPAQPTHGISLQPKDAMTHELHLGSLAHPGSGAIVPLSALQLADLATALDDCVAELPALPEPAPPRSWQPTIPAWGKFAAASVLGVGLLTSVVHLLDRSKPNQPTGQIAVLPSKSSDQRRSGQPLPTTSVSPTPQPTFATIPLPIGSPSSKSLSPKVALSPLPPGASFTLPKVASSGTPSPGTSSASVKIAATPFPAVKLPAPTSLSVAPIAKGPTLKLNPTAEPNSGKQSGKNPASAAPSPDLQKVAIATALKPALKPLPTQSESLRVQPGALKATTNPSAVSPLNQPPAASAPISIPIGAPISAQAREVRAYFQKRWQPAQQLQEPIQYRLTLKPNGTIATILPIGEAASTFLDRTGMPLQGEPFISAHPKGQSTVIRVVLTPAGAVQTFQESEPDR